MWRKLRRLGAVQLVDGLVALPADATTVEAFDWLADEVLEAGGEAWTWRAQAGSKQQHTALRERLSQAAAQEYRNLIAEVDEAAVEPSRRTVERLRRELHHIDTKDRVGVKEREQAHRAVDRLAATVDGDQEARR